VLNRCVELNHCAGDIIWLKQGKTGRKSDLGRSSFPFIEHNSTSFYSTLNTIGGHIQRRIEGKINRNQKTENRKQKTEIRNQKTENRNLRKQKTEI